MVARRNAFFHVQAPENYNGARRLALNIEEFEFYRYHVAARHFQYADVHKVIAQMCCDDPGLRKARVRLMLGFVYRLQEQLPELAPYVFQDGLVTPDMACAMERAFQDLPTTPPLRLTQALQRVLIQRFTPRVEHQRLPTPRALRKVIERVLSMYGSIDQVEKTAKPNYWSVPSLNSGLWLIGAEVDKLTAESMDRHIEAVAKNEKISKVEAMTRLICGTAKTTNITIIGIGENSPTEALTVAELEHFGKLDVDTQLRVHNYPVRYRNALEIANLRRDIYHPTDDQRAVVRLRDGHCRFPGCETPASACDIDHVITFEAGGWTALGNLQCLCRGHHNLKTDRKVTAHMDSDGAVTWQDTDPKIGKEYQNLGTTFPEGPLAGLCSHPTHNVTRHSGKTTADDNTSPPIRRGMGRFGTTIDANNETIRQSRQAERERHVDPEDDTPPPF
ncbi:HNH endonuclease signature motif containing protein [Corynebacterium freiburgense]|uniref:HNH endonuclease signature motif containing protein n=1 Tax=Corynebacterium freiburgense TaxID=556548 RepID=UPI00047D2D53|nr:HNH endonuclease signature motif containing protein [Corynebacterium freiburgense]WJZ03179.1 hypothetical protein CFREI_09505 [Corynebacterium freiburgense]